MGSVTASWSRSHSPEWLFYWLLALVLLGCDSQTVPVQLEGATMGTTWHVSYVAGTTALQPEFMQKGIQDALDRVNLSMSTYLQESEISRFNTLDTNVWFKTSAEFYRVLTTALEIGDASEGAYDVTVAPLVDLWGFGPDASIDAPPPDAEIEKRLSEVGQKHLVLDSGHLSIMKQSELSLDFSSLAKGFAVDQVAQWLLAQGLDRFMVEVGGEMRLSGLSGRGDPWHIAIEQPQSNTRAAAESISLTDVAIATSGDYRNFFESGGRRYSHTIDPRTGYPVTHDLVSVTVVHTSCMIADAWATALSVLGPERAMAVARQQGLAVYFIRRVGEGYEHSHTPEFSGYLTESQP